MTVNTASARYEGLGKEGRGRVTFASGVLDAPYGYGTRFEGQPGTNPEEMIAGAHAACFTMATSFALARAGHTDGTLETECKVTLEQSDGGFTVTRSAGGRSQGRVPDLQAAELRDHAGDPAGGVGTAPLKSRRSPSRRTY